MEIIGFINVQFLLAVAALVIGLLCAAVVWAATRGVGRQRKAAISAALIFPIVATFYLEAGLIGYSFVRYALGKDAFINGIYHYPLVNGYRVVIFDKMPEMADIDHLKGDAGPVDLSQVRGVQVSGPLIIAEAYKGNSASDWNGPANQFVVIDSATGAQREYPSQEVLRSEMQRRGISLNFDSTEELLMRAERPGVIGWMVFIVLMLPVVAKALVFMRRLKTLRDQTQVAYSS